MLFILTEWHFIARWFCPVAPVFADVLAFPAVTLGHDGWIKLLAVLQYVFSGNRLDRNQTFVRDHLVNAQVLDTDLLLLLGEWIGLDRFVKPFLHFCSVGVELGFGHVLHRQVDDADVLEAIAWLFEVFRK